MEMKYRRLEISVADFRRAFEAEPLASFNRTFDKNYEPVAKKIAQGEYFRFWSRLGNKLLFYVVECNAIEIIL